MEQWAKEPTPFGVCCRVSRGHLQRGLHFYVCSQHLSLELSFHRPFDFKAIYTPRQSVLKIGFLTKNGTGITHSLLGSPLTLGCHTSGGLEECAAVIIHSYVLLRAGFEPLPSFGSSHWFFFHVLIQCSGLSPFASLGHTSSQTTQPSGKNTQEMQLSPVPPAATQADVQGSAKGTRF